MKKIVYVTILMALVGCSDHSHFEKDPECSTSKSGNVVKLTCNGETVELKDGVDGLNGADGQNGVDGADGVNGTNGLFVDIIDPCGQEGNYDEVILVTNAGQFVAYFAQNGAANQSRLTILEEGPTYKTTDGTNCKFKVENGVIVDVL